MHLNRVRSFYFTFALAVAASSVTAEIPNPLLLDLPNRQWTRLPSSGLETAGTMEIGCCDLGAPCMIEYQGILAYSGAALDSNNQRIILWGGGHNDYFGNQLLTFDLETLSWNLEYDPTSLCLYGDQPDYRFLNGMPVSRHTYDHIGYIDHLDLFFSYSGACSDEEPYNGGTSYGDVWTYDFSVSTWTDHTDRVIGGNNFSLTQPGNSGEYDPETGLWFQLTESGVWAFDFTTFAWTQRTAQGPPGIERSSVLDPDRRRIWSYGGGDATLSYYDIEENRFVIVSTDNPPGNREAAGLTYDRARRELVLYGGSADRTVWNYKPDTATWGTFRRANAPLSPQTYGRFLYDETHDLFVLIPNVESVWVWKNSRPKIGTEIEPIP